MRRILRDRKAPLIVGLLLCWASVAGQTRSPEAGLTPTEEAAGGSITGSVVNESGQALAGARVSVRSNGGGAVRISITDAEGNFRVDDLAPALYSVSVFYPAYVMPSINPTWTPRYSRVGDSLRFELVRGGVITGKVIDSAGEPVIGVAVRATMVRDAAGEVPRAGGNSFSQWLTDDRGVYRVFGLPAGTYLVSAGGASFSQGFSLDPYGLDVPTYAPSSTFDTAAEISVRSGEEVNADIRYRGERGHVVSGSMKIADTSSGSLTLTAAGRMTTPLTAFQLPSVRGFQFSGVSDGEYDVVGTEIKSPRSAAAVVPEIWVSEPKRIVVKGADVTGLELAPRPLPSIGGRIVLEASKMAECEGKRRPLFAEMAVFLQRPEKENGEEKTPLFLRHPEPSSPDAGGNFLLSNLTPGRYLFDLRFYARYWYLDSISTAFTPKVDPAANWLTLKFGDRINNVTIKLAEGAASLRGHLKATDDATRPAGLAVYLLPAEREKTADVLRYFLTTVEADGTFSVNNVPPDRYLVMVQPVAAQTNTLAKLRLPESAEARADLRRAAALQKTELELKPCQNLTDFPLSLKP